MTPEHAAIITAVSMILCANVYAALWHRLRLPTDPRRIWHMAVETWRQMREEDKGTALVLAGSLVALLWVGTL
jgi:hypothetical protein